MKKRVVSLSSLLLASAPALSYEAIDNDIAYLHFYGTIKASAQFLEEQDNEYTFGDSKVGLLGRYAVTDVFSIAAGTEAQINLDADEDKNEDDLYVSQYFLGLYTEAFGWLTFGKHSTSSDDLNGVDYSEIFGGQSNLNSVGVKGDTLKYVYANELFTLNATYGFEAGDQNRTLSELFGQYNLADLTLIAGIGTTSTNTATNQTDSTYFQTSAKMEMGDTNFGLTYYLQNLDNDLQPSLSVDKHAFALAGQIAFTEGVTAYAGHELIFQDSKTKDLDGTRQNSYVGLSLIPIEYTKLFAELNFNSPISTKDELNLAVGGVLSW
ncbi:porin [Vibrio renipiscarius]|uniref:Membrane protein n=1 Tax=Vibrio renipiscarius TaxID=1461322 RepID=A0A0C2N8N9_9VIBR|nr:porin [Vibrio renipiscarius]KII76026.1 membrane protein [Vibrio renipiscarius]KII79130.1 membrane protein [Vibrio renipiscarius]